MSFLFFLSVVAFCCEASLSVRMVLMLSICSLLRLSTAVGFWENWERFPQHWNGGDINTFIYDLDQETKCCYFLSAEERRGFTQIMCSAGNFALVSVSLCYFIFVQKVKLLGQKFKESLVNLPRFTVSGLFFLQFFVTIWKHHSLLVFQIQQWHMSQLFIRRVTMGLLQENRKQSLGHLFLNKKFIQNTPRHFL